MSQVFCVLDYETRSRADLKKVGAWEYSLDKSTQIICVAWKVGTRETLRAAKTKTYNCFVDDDPNPLVEVLQNPEIRLVAQNAFFEQAITRNGLKFKTPINRWICTASLAASHALPRNLEGACQVLGLPVQKDMEGRRLILKYCKPRRPTLHNKKEWHDNAEEIKRIIKYCATDVDATTELFLRLPPLNGTERKVWELDQKINMYGFGVDRDLVASILLMIQEETDALHTETKKITRGALNSVAQQAVFLKLLQHEGIQIQDLQAKTVSDKLSELDNLSPTVRRLLEIRQSISKSSTKKYHAFEIRSRSDGRCRDNLVYHQASTGRWAGTGVQPQNFPRGNVKDTGYACSVLRDGDLEWVRLLYRNPMDVFASCLRGMIIAPPNRTFFCGDYASIEARVLFWVAGHDTGLEAYEQDRDLYREMASVVYDTPLEKVTKTQRALGKGIILGCGYGMGPDKFQATCEAQGLIVSEDLAKKAVATYRQIHSPIPRFWRRVEQCAIAAVEHPRLDYAAGCTKWSTENDFLYCKLPSGRRLAYYQPEVRYEDTPWGEKRPKLYHGGVSGYTHKWEHTATYGGRLCENVVQAIARDLMAEAMLNLDKAGYDIVLSVHDEILAEADLSVKRFEGFQALMSLAPHWAKGLPVKVEAWQGDRYHK